MNLKKLSSFPWPHWHVQASSQAAAAIKKTPRLLTLRKQK